MEIFDFVVFISTINKQSRFIGSVLFLVEMVWMRSHVQAASIKEDLHSVATIGSGGQLAAPLAGRGSDSNCLHHKETIILIRKISVLWLFYCQNGDSLLFFIGFIAKI